MQRRLIVNADDFGRSPGVTNGILRAHHDGIVSSTTLMVNLPWSEAAAGLGREVPALSVGLHLSFCYGPALGNDVGSLLGADGLLDRDLESLRARALAVDVERETRAQLNRFIELMGALPSHLDSHQHVHTWPTAAPVVAAIAREHGLPVRAGNPEHASLLRSAGVSCPDRFIPDFFGMQQVTIERLAKLLRSLPGGVSELMCHPGDVDEALADSSYRDEREAERRVLTSRQIKDVILDEGIEIISFRDIQTAG